MSDYEIHPDIAQAHTLPGSFYSDHAAHEKLKQEAFASSWQWFAVRDAAPQPGSVFPFTLLENWLNTPLILSRDHNERLHCLSNVCTHRGNLIATARGTHQSLRCRYHGRRFGLDGTCQSMPAFDEVSNFPCKDDHLPQLQMGMLGRLLFTSLSPKASFASWMEGVTERIDFMPLDQFQLDSSRTKTYTVSANWALYIDNFLEGFHIPFVHPALNAAIDLKQYQTVLLPHGNVQVAPAAEGETCFELPPEHPDFGRRIAAYYFWLFPNLMLNFYPWGLSLNIVEPQAMDLTRIRFLTYVWKPHLLGSGAGSDLDRVELEDEAVVMNVQKGVQSQLYTRGRYSPRMEKGVHQFHRMICEVL